MFVDIADVSDKNLICDFLFQFVGAGVGCEHLFSFSFFFRHKNLAQKSISIGVFVVFYP